ncbi:unnamed protein product, partial [Gulo gulo]
MRSQRVNNFLEMDIWEGGSVYRKASSNKCVNHNDSKRQEECMPSCPPGK